MKSIYLTVLVSLLFTSLTSTTCCKEPKGDKRLDDSKSWLPLTGRTSLSFIDENGTPILFPLQVTNGIENINTGCGSYIQEYIQANLFLNSARTDSIFLSLSGPNILNIQAVSDNKINISYNHVLAYQSPEKIEMHKNVTLGGRSYNEVVLAMPYKNDSHTIDSIFLANNQGLIGFKYKNKQYQLQ